MLALRATLFMVLLAIATPALAQQGETDEALSLESRAIDLFNDGRHGEAESLLNRALTSLQRHEGIHFYASKILYQLGYVYERLERFAQAEQAFQRSLAVHQQTHGPDAPTSAALMHLLAEFYMRRGRDDEAVAVLERALAIEEKAFGADDFAITKSLRLLADAYRLKGRRSQAESLYNRALSIQEDWFGPEGEELPPLLIGLASVHRLESRDADAEPLLRRAVAILERTRGPEHLDLGSALSELASVLRSVKQHDESVTAYRRSLAIYEKGVGPGHPHVASLLHSLAKTYKELRRFDDAIALAERSVAIRKDALAPDDPRTADALENLADAHMSLLSLAQAESALTQALAIREKSSTPWEHGYHADTLRQLGELYRRQGRIAESERALKQALRVLEDAFGPDDFRATMTFHFLGRLYLEQGRHPEAEQAFKRALALLEKEFGPAYPGAVLMIGELASVYARQGRFAEAELFARRALEISEQDEGTDSAAYAKILMKVSDLYERQRRYAEAAALIEHALAIFEREVGSSHHVLAPMLGNLAQAYLGLGRNDDAASTFRRALAIREKALGPDHPDVATSLNGLAQYYRRLGRLDEAERLQSRALAIQEQSVGTQHLHAIIYRTNLAEIYWLQGRTADAYASAKEAFEALRRWVDAGANEATPARDAERDSIRFNPLFFLFTAAEQAREAPRHAAAISAEAFIAAQFATRSSADRALAQAAVRFAAADTALARLARQRQDTADRRNALDKAIVAASAAAPDERDTAREAAMRDELTVLARQLATVDDRLRREYPEFAELSNPRPVSLQEAQELLAPYEALVAFVVAGNGTYRFVVRRHTAEFRRIDVDAAKLSGLIRALRLELDPTGIGSLAELGPYDAHKAHELHRLLFAGSAPILAGATSLLVVPDGPVGGLPFAVLVSRPPTEALSGIDGYRSLAWLARDFAVTVLPSVGALRALRIFAARSQVTRKPFLGFGDPELGGRRADAKGAQKAQANLRSRGAVADVDAVRDLGELPDTADELRRIARALGADPVTSLHLRAQATEGRAKTAELSNYRVLAFATHGLMAGEFEGFAEPALVLTPPAKGDETDDGLLSASEVAQLKLNADWVILSACNTAAPDGAPGAEGLSGLARAFFYAGSRALLVSHWPVYSDASVRLTTGAIEALARDPSLGRAEAVRRSMMALLDDSSLPAAYAHPAIWAPFSLVGEGGAGR